MSGGARGGGSGRGFYGWWIVGAGFSLEALIGALMFHSYGAYVVVLREEFGWSKTMLSAAFAMARAESGILGPVQGWLTDRFGPTIFPTHTQTPSRRAGSPSSIRVLALRVSEVAALIWVLRLLLGTLGALRIFEKRFMNSQALPIFRHPRLAHRIQVRYLPN